MSSGVEREIRSEVSKDRMVCWNFFFAQEEERPSLLTNKWGTNPSPKIWVTGSSSNTFSLSSKFRRPFQISPQVGCCCRTRFVNHAKNKNKNQKHKVCGLSQTKRIYTRNRSRTQLQCKTWNSSDRHNCSSVTNLVLRWWISPLPYSNNKFICTRLAQHGMRNSNTWAWPAQYTGKKQKQKNSPS